MFLGNRSYRSYQNKKSLPGAGFSVGLKSSRLLADTELLLGDDRTVAVDVLADEVIEEAAALTYESLKRTGCCIVLVVVLKVLCEVLDAYREQCNLALRATGVAGACAVSLENFLLFFCLKMHN